MLVDDIKETSKYVGLTPAKFQNISTCYWETQCTSYICEFFTLWIAINMIIYSINLYDLCILISNLKYNFEIFLAYL